MWETQVRSLGQEDPLEKEMAAHSSTLAWRIPWREEPGRLQSMGWQRVGHDWETSLSLSGLCEAGRYGRKSMFRARLEGWLEVIIAVKNKWIQTQVSWLSVLCYFCNKWELLVLNIPRGRTDWILVLRRIQVKKYMLHKMWQAPHFANQPQNSLLLILDLASNSSQLSALGS